MMATNNGTSMIMKWKELKDSTGICPKPRHGHRCVAYGKYLILIGGGNEGIIKDINVYNTANGKWFYPSTSGVPPPGCAAFGIAIYDTNILIFGGIHEHGIYSNDIYRISVINWSWVLCTPTVDEGCNLPCPRLGHSFTISSTNKIYMFGGLTNEESIGENSPPKYLNDLYVLNILDDGYLHWSKPNCSGVLPQERESHSAVTYFIKGRETLIIYGGMCGHRLGDINFLDLETFVWSQPIATGIIPPPRSLHVSGVCQNKMIVFGGWIPLNENSNHEDPNMYNLNEWKVTNNVSCLNLDTLNWESVSITETEETVPRARAGHCGVVLNNRLYVWSGRDGHRKSWNDQVCCRDMWFLEISKALPPSRILMDGSDTCSVSVRWDPIPNADYYIIQVLKVGNNTVCNSQDFRSIIQQRNIQNAKKELFITTSTTTTNSQLLPALKLLHQPPGNIEDLNKNMQVIDRFQDQINLADVRNTNVLEGQNLDISNISYIQRSNDVNLIKTENIVNLGVRKITEQIPNIHNPQILNSTMINLENTPTFCQQSFDNSIITQNTIRPPPLCVTSLPQPTTTGLVNNYQKQLSIHLASPKKINVFNEVPVNRWFESIIVSESKATISQFQLEVGFEKSTANRASSSRRSIPLEANYTYRLRIASVNSCGIGSFSQTLTFSTCAPGLPGPPSCVKVVKKAEDVYLIWSSSQPGELLEYTVYVSKPIGNETVLPVNISHLKYIYEQVYQGRETKCLLTPHIEDAYVFNENSQNASLMFRIVPKNSKGYGPVTQVKWLKNEHQDIRRRSQIEKFELPLKRFRVQ